MFLWGEGLEDTPGPHQWGVIGWPDPSRFREMRGAWPSVAEAQAGRGDRSVFQESCPRGLCRAQVVHPGDNEAAAPHLPGASILCAQLYTYNLIVFLKGTVPLSRKMYKLKVPQSLGPCLGKGFGWKWGLRSSEQGVAPGPALPLASPDLYFNSFNSFSLKQKLFKCPSPKVVAKIQ